MSPAGGGKKEIQSHEQVFYPKSFKGNQGRDTGAWRSTRYDNESLPKIVI